MSSGSIAPDVTFILGTQMFKAHKSILSNQSQYFMDLFNNVQMEHMNLEIEIRDFDPRVFKKILDFIYTNNVVLTDFGALEDILSLMDGATFYKLPRLLSTLEEWVSQHYVNASTVASLWKYSHDSGLARLDQVCKDFVRKNVDAVIDVPGLTEQLWAQDEGVSDAHAHPDPFLFDHDFFPGVPNNNTTTTSTTTNASNIPSLPIQNQQQSFLQPQTPTHSHPGSNNATAHGHNVHAHPHNSHISPNSSASSINVLQGMIFTAPSSPPSSPPTSDNTGATTTPNATDKPSKKGSKSRGRPTKKKHSVTERDIQQPPLPPGVKPPPDYKTLTVAQNPQKEQIPMLHGELWSQAMEKMSTVLDLLRDVTKADISSLFLFDPSSNELYSHVTHPDHIDIAIPGSLGIAGHCFQTGEIINTPAAYTDVRFYSGIDRKVGTPTLAMLAVPVVCVHGDHQKRLGVIELLNKKRKDPFSKMDEQETLTVARMVAAIVHKTSREIRAKMKEEEEQGKPEPPTKKRKKDNKGVDADDMIEDMPVPRHKGIRRSIGLERPIMHFKPETVPTNPPQPTQQPQQQQTPTPLHQQQQPHTDPLTSISTGSTTPGTNPNTAPPTAT